MEQFFTLVIQIFGVLCFVIAAILLILLAVFFIRVMMKDFWK